MNITEKHLLNLMEFDCGKMEVQISTYGFNILKSEYKSGIQRH